MRNEHARSGHTLIEMLVALMLITFVFGTIGLMMHVAGDANRRVRDEVELEHGLSRFAAQLRSDAHQAQSATTRDSAAPQARASVLSLALPEQRTIEYALVPHRVERVVRRGEAVLHRETYPLPASSLARWHLETGRAATMVSLLMEPGAAAPTGRSPALDTYRMDAAVQLFSTRPVLKP
ncbi:MAG: prepilin-type N-terminal cleavage/methylation domain-containing protein [Thermoguttaceae bacterium]